MTTAAEIQAWLLERLQDRLDDDAEPVEPHLPFSYYGLDSIDAFELAAELEEWLGQPVSESLTFDYPTVSAVARYLAGEPDGVVTDPVADGRALLAELQGPGSPAGPPAPAPPS
jgi:acyl carrier protein